MSAQPLTTDRGTSAWRLTDAVATCSSARGLNGRLNLLQPQIGVQIDLAGGTVHLLGVALETPLANETLADGYERVADLVATYLPT
ncbi:MAG: hypothetical protein JNM18_21315, partial [Planctomycetaceae bacterium]|nr:hypothetical protein [Planctomycetaceae bacterium]